MRYIGKYLILLICVLSVNSANAYVTSYQSRQQPDDQQQSRFSAGQVWSYKTRQNELNSTLTILRVDYFEDAVVVHIRLDNIKLLDPSETKGYRSSVTHMAFLQTALETSVVKVFDNKRVPDFSTEYQNWRDGDGIGSAWAWHYSVSEALSGLEEFYNYKQQTSDIKNNLQNN